MKSAANKLKSEQKKNRWKWIATNECFRRAVSIYLPRAMWAGDHVAWDATYRMSIETIGQSTEKKQGKKRSTRAQASKHTLHWMSVESNLNSIWLCLVVVHRHLSCSLACERSIYWYMCIFTHFPRLQITPNGIDIIYTLASHTHSLCREFEMEQNAIIVSIVSLLWCVSMRLCV